MPCVYLPYSTPTLLVGGTSFDQCTPGLGLCVYLVEVLVLVDDALVMSCCCHELVLSEDLQGRGSLISPKMSGRSIVESFYK